MFSASVASQLRQILDQLQQSHPLLWTLECERAYTELMVSTGDENAIVNMSEVKEQVGLWFQKDSAGEKEKKMMKKKNQEGQSVQAEAKGSWIDDQEILKRNFVTRRQGRGYDREGFVV